MPIRPSNEERTNIIDNRYFASIPTRVFNARADIETTHGENATYYGHFGIEKAFYVGAVRVAHLCFFDVNEVFGNNIPDDYTLKFAYSIYCANKFNYNKSRYIEENGYTCVRADMKEWTFLSSDVDNYLAVLYCCKYGIALFDRREEDSFGFSPNVAYELGIMLSQNKKCFILKHKDLDQVPFVLAQRFFKEYYDGTQIPSLLKPWLNTISREERVL